MTNKTIWAVGFLLTLLASQLRAASGDPFEPTNRVILKLNDGIDRVLIAPVTRAYMAVTPNVIEQRIALFFANLTGVTSVANSLAQLKPKKAVRHLGRFTINSTLGLFGLFDVASRWGLQESSEDFGQTLGYWGMPQGPYLVLPLLGPTTLRDAGGLLVDNQTDPLTHYPADPNSQLVISGVEVLSTRAGLFKYDALITGDRYSMMRDLYIQNRAFEVSDGQVADSFTDDFDDASEFLDESF